MSNLVKYSEGIQIIVDEHIPLRKQMEEIRGMISDLEQSDVNANSEQVEKLNRVASSFIQQVEPHSEAEDQLLSPLLGKYLGMDAPPVTGNAAQHQEARLLLKQYREELQAFEGDQSRISGITESLSGAIKVLTEHFDFEEANLFPLAEKTLSDEDKRELSAKLKARS